MIKINIFLIIISAIFFFAHNTHFAISQNAKSNKKNNRRYFYSIGNFSCNGTPEANVTVTLYRKTRKLMNRKELNKSLTNQSGEFDIFGRWKNSTLFVNYMSFTHKCNVTDLVRCNRTFWLPFPPEKAKNTSDEAMKDPYEVIININSTTEAVTNFGNETCVNGTDNGLTTV